MTDFNSTNQLYNSGAIPYYNQAAISAPAYNMPQNTVPVQQSGVTNPIYNYPSASIYDPNQKQQMSGVNIYVYNPSALGGNGQCPPIVTTTPPNQMPATNMYGNTPVANTPIAETPVANTPIAEQPKETDNKKKRPVTELTNNYIKTLESYLRSDDASLRNMGIKEVLKRFEEDESRYDNKPLTALLNIALQDTDTKNRLLAMSVVAGGSAHGDNNTILLLQNLQNSDKMYGQEAKMASEALLKAAETRSEQ